VPAWRPPGLLGYRPGLCQPVSERVCYQIGQAYIATEIPPKLNLLPGKAVVTAVPGRQHSCLPFARRRPQHETLWVHLISRGAFLSFPSLTVSLTVSPSPSLSPSLSLCLHRRLSRRLSHCVSIAVSLTVSLTLSLTVSLPPHRRRSCGTRVAFMWWGARCTRRGESTTSSGAAQGARATRGALCSSRR
jgi:hypothetical protein